MESRIERLCIERGVKMTEQRRVVARVLSDASDHPDVEELYRRYAAAIDRYTKSPEVPLWARQMEIFILEDMNELAAARILLGGLLESGTIRDPAEARFLRQRLEELERKTRP